MKFIYKEINETETDCIEFICNLAKFKDQEEKLFKTKQDSRIQILQTLISK